MIQDRPGNSGAKGFPGEPGVGVDLAAPFAPRDPSLHWLFGLNRMGIRPGLERIRGLLDDLGNPERRVRTLVVAGTNGKGSTTRILARLLQAAGYRTATYTSPHLLQVTERIQVAETSVDAGEFAERARAIRPLVDRHEASWFETLTALAVRLAADHGVDWFCCETGLGGRLDASNALPAEGILLTTIGLDHQRILGETLPEIAAEKLGLLKRGVPLFCGVQEELRSQVFTAAVKAGSPCHFVDELARWEDPRVEGGPWDLVLRDRVIEGLPDPGGPVLRRNAALALLALAEIGKTAGLPLAPADPAAALGNLFLPGRYQLLLSRPDWILDTAHNMQALQVALGQFLARPCRGRRVLLLGSMHDKEWPGELGALVRRADAVVAAPVSLPRSRRAGELSALLEAWGLEPAPWSGPGTDLARCRVAPDLAGAVGHLAARLGPDDAVLATGSCFLVGETLHVLGYGDLADSAVVRPASEVLGERGKVEP
ncbi:MAG: folylpolyglutamate synthase/dihydrofolate synthase family protein [Candidatus Krumholzibacteriia bacterium]